LSAIDLLKYVHLAYFSKPKSERAVYRTIRRVRPRSVVEIGIGDVTRSQRIIKLCTRIVGVEQFRYTGIDLFEAREATQPGITLKLAHKILKPMAAKVQLVPGDPFSALSRTANSLTQTDLIIIRSDQDVESMNRAWFYLPRMLSERCKLFHEQESNSGEKKLCHLTVAEVTELAKDRSGRRAA
jgi:hypothetical protein